MLECINKHLELKASIYEAKPNKTNLPKRFLLCVAAAGTQWINCIVFWSNSPYWTQKVLQ
jgi:hypothetical protein